MIGDLLIYALYQFINLIVLILPTPENLPQGINNTFTTLGNMSSQMNSIFPMDTLMICLGFYLTFTLAVMTFKMVNFIINKVRGSG